MNDVVTEDNDPVTSSLEQLVQAASGFSTGPYYVVDARLVDISTIMHDRRKKEIVDKVPATYVVSGSPTLVLWPDDVGEC
jgi:hypothetical protein